MAENNVIARKQPAAPEGVKFPIWLWRPNGRSACATDAKEYGDLQRAGYVSEEKIPMATPEPHDNRRMARLEARKQAAAEKEPERKAAANETVKKETKAAAARKKDAKAKEKK